MDYLYLFLIEDRRRLNNTSIENLTRAMERDSKLDHSLICTCLKHRAAELRTLVGEEQKVYANEVLNWISSIVEMEKIRGEVLNISEMEVGDFLPDGSLVETCPWCGRPAIVYNDPDPQYAKVAFHKMTVSSGMAQTIEESCRPEGEY